MAVRKDNPSSIHFENLEDRRLMSVALNNGVLRITGTNNADHVTVDQNATDVFVFENNQLSKIAPVSQVTTIAFDAYGGNDDFKATRFVTKPITVYAGAGDDHVETGSGNDYVFAGLGNDVVYGRAGNDRIEGADGNDLIFGGIGNDVISGSLGNDNIYAEEGNDTVNGGAGDDDIHGGVGNDVMHGDDGNDYVFGDPGNDVLFGDGGNDSITSYGGRDTMFGNDGDDKFYAARDNASGIIDGGAGYDGAWADMGTAPNPFVKDVLINIEYTFVKT